MGLSCACLKNKYDLTRESSLDILELEIVSDRREIFNDKTRPKYGCVAQRCSRKFKSRQNAEKHFCWDVALSSPSPHFEQNEHVQYYHYT